MNVFDNSTGALDPATMGLLSAAFAGLQASGPQRTPTSFGQVVGQAGQAGLGTYANTLNQNRQFAQTQALVDLEKAKTMLTLQQAQRQGRLGAIMGGGATTPFAPQSAPPYGPVTSPPPPVTPQVSGGGGGVMSDEMKAADFMGKAELLAKEGFFAEANQVAEFAKKIYPDLVFKDGVWYDKKGTPVRGGAGVNQQGFGYQTRVSPEGAISVGELPGAKETYLAQQRIGEQARSERDLVTVPATSPGAQPTYATRESLLKGGVPAGMSPAAAATQAASAAQEKEISENYGKIYNQWQNNAMQNPAKMAKLQKIGSLLGDFEGGKLSQTGMDLASAANSLGLKIDPKLPNKQAAEALSSEVALELRSTGAGAGMPGAMSDQDRNFLKGMTPNLAQTAEGRKIIIDSRVKVMEREIQVAKMARQYKQKHGTVGEDFFNQLSEWSNRNHIFK